VAKRLLLATGAPSKIQAGVIGAGSRLADAAAAMTIDDDIVPPGISVNIALFAKSVNAPFIVKLEEKFCKR
jgi:hypothetical protein